MLSTTSSTTVAEDKAALRRQVRLTLEGLSPEAVRRGDDALFAAFSALPQAEAASTLFAFCGILGREPDTGRLIRALTARGKRVGLPRMLPGRQMEVRLYEPDRPWSRRPSGSWSRQRTPPSRPAGHRPGAGPRTVCYDRRGFRLGFGGGYYDRWLSGFSGFTVGLCRDCVLQDRVPTEDHDCRVDLLLTETRRFLR